MCEPIITIVETTAARFFKDGRRYYVEAGHGNKYRKRLVPVRRAQDALHTFSVLGWDEGGKRAWLDSNLETLINKQHEESN